MIYFHYTNEFFSGKHMCYLRLNIIPSLGIQVSQWMEEEREKLDQGTTKTLCLPFFSILQALGNPQVDYLSLDVEGSELSILKTIPWEQVKIKVGMPY